MFAMVSQFGFSMLTPILAGFFLGMFIDKKCGTNFWMIILFVLGTIVGFRNIYVLATGSMNKHKYSRNRDEDSMPVITSEEEAIARQQNQKLQSKGENHAK